MLEVKTNLIVNNKSDSEDIIVVWGEDKVSEYLSLGIQDVPGGYGRVVISAGHGSGNTGTNLVIRTAEASSGGAETQRAIVTQQGFVGIDTMAPLVALHVN